jgi:rubrerythrin
VGTVTLGNGQILTAVDRMGNAEADRLAKLAVATHRVPEEIRKRVNDQRLLVDETARWVAMATWAAGHQECAPHRDTDASRAAALLAARRRGQHSLRGRGRLVKVVEQRPAALGGHALSKDNGVWRCGICWVKSKDFCKLAPKVCPGSAAMKWAQRAKVLAEQDFIDGGGHTTALSGSVLWCTKCGAYACTAAKGLAKPCPGRLVGKWGAEDAQGGQAPQDEGAAAPSHSSARVWWVFKEAEAQLVGGKSGQSVRAQQRRRGKAQGY